MRLGRIVDFDRSVSAQSRLCAALAGRLQTIELQAEARNARLWCSPGRFATIAASLQGAPAVSFLGSGDYHHFTLPLLAALPEAVTLLLFDNHPDWMRPPHRYHCGTWVHAAARLPQVRRIIIVGLESGDVEGKAFAGGDLASFEAGRIVLLPTKTVTARLPGGQTLTLPGCLEAGAAAAQASILAAVGEGPVYVSLDKDCLMPADACTNWEQGSLSLSFVLDTLRALGARNRIVGADTVGDWSPPQWSSPLKWLGSWLDRGARTWESAPASPLAVNEAVNLAFLEVLDACPA